MEAEVSRKDGRLAVGDHGGSGDRETKVGTVQRVGQGGR